MMYTILSTVGIVWVPAPSLEVQHDASGFYWVIIVHDSIPVNRDATPPPPGMEEFTAQESQICRLYPYNIIKDWNLQDSLKCGNCFLISLSAP